MNSLRLWSLGAIILCFGLLSESQAKNCPSEEDDTISIALSSRPNNLNPFFSTDANSQNINRLIHTSLLEFDGEMSLQCRLCESFEESYRDDGKHIVRFKLDRSARFWDGTSVTAKDVYQSWRYFTDEQEIRSIFRFAFQRIEKVNILSSYEVELVFSDSYLDNLTNLVLLKILKIETELEGVPSLDDMIGAGPYQIKETNPLNIVLLPSDLNKQMPILDFKVVRDETTLALKLINEEIDFSVAHMSPRKVDWLRENHSESLKFWEKETSNFIYLGINHRRDHLADLDARRALAMLIPREKIIKYKLRNTAVLSHGMFSRAFGDLSFSEDPINNYRPGEAIKMLNKLGYTDEEPLIIDWKSPSTRSTLENVHTIAHFLEKGPVKVNVTTQEWGTFMRSFSQGRYDIVLGQWVGFSGPEMLENVFHSGKVPPDGNNRGHFIDPFVDELLDRVIHIREHDERTFIFRQVIERVNQKLAYINLWHPKIVWISSNCVTTGDLHPNGSFLPFLKLKKECCRGE